MQARQERTCLLRDHVHEMTLMTIVRSVIETIGGIWALIVLAFKTRLRLRGKYWRWRFETAFGHEPDRFTTRGQRLRAMIEYGRWVYRMKKRM